METRLLSGDLKDIWIIQPVNGGIRYVHNMPLWQSFSLPWEYAQIKELEFMNDNISGGEIYYTPTVSVEGYVAFGIEGLLLGEDERRQRPFIHTVCFFCALTDGRCFVAEVSPRDWIRWQKLAAKPFNPPLPKEQQSFSSSWKSTSWITKAAIYIFLYFLALAFLGFIGETITHAVKTGWSHLSR